MHLYYCSELKIIQGNKGENYFQVKQNNIKHVKKHAFPIMALRSAHTQYVWGGLLLVIITPASRDHQGWCHNRCHDEP